MNYYVVNSNDLGFYSNTTQLYQPRVYYSLTLTDGMSMGLIARLGFLWACAILDYHGANSLEDRGEFLFIPNLS